MKDLILLSALMPFAVYSQDEFDEIQEDEHHSTGNIPVPQSDDMIDQAIDDNNASSANAVQNLFMKLSRALQSSGDILGTNTFLLEMILCGVLIVWTIMFFYGRNANKVIATKWIRNHQELLQTQFAKLSSGSADTSDAGALLFKESLNNFTFFASGRIHCEGLVGSVSLLRRHDLIMRAVDAIAFPHHDKVTFQIPLSGKGGQICLFALCRKGKHVAFREETPEFQEFAPRTIQSVFPSNLIAMCESPEALTSGIFDTDALEVINKLGDLIELISCTDLNRAPVQGFPEIPTRLLTCVFRIGNTRKCDEMKSLVELMLRLVDTMYSLRLSPAAANKIRKNRKTLEDRAAKKIKEQQQSEAARKKQEKLEKEKEEERAKYESLSESAKQKWDLKEEKRKRKEENSKMFKMVKK